MSVEGMRVVGQALDPRDAVLRRLSSGPDAAYVAGGTLIDRDAAHALVDVTRLPVLNALHAGADGLRIGAAVRLERLRRDGNVRLLAPLLASSCDSLGSLAVRNLATIGGNIGARIGDTLAPLLVLGAEVDCLTDEGISPADGDPTPERISLAQLLAMPTLPLMISIHLPVQPTCASPGSSTLAVFEKVGHRAAFSPSRLVIALVARRRDDGEWGQVCAAATGSGLPARRLVNAEAALLAGARPAGYNARRLRDACVADLPEHPAIARLACRLLIGHLSLPS